MNIVYVVTKGIYSDKHVEGAYSTLELARQAIENAVAIEVKETEREPQYLRDEYGITAWNLDGELYNSSALWLVDYTPEFPGEVWRCDIADVDENEPNFVSLRKVSTFYGMLKRWSVYVYADNRDAALKIANEKIMMAIAGGM